MLKKTFSAITAMCILSSAVPFTAGAQAQLEKENINYTESTDHDLGSCDSGYTSTAWIRAEPGKDWTTNVSRYTLLLIGIGGYSSGMNGKGLDYDFDEPFFKGLEGTLKSARANGATVGIRFRYDDNGTTDPEPATFDKVLYHIKQIKDSGLLEKYSDVISFFESGFVGSWGEHWGGKYTSLEYKAKLLDACLDIVPDTVPVTVRTPNTFRQWLKDFCNVTVSAKNMGEEAAAFIATGTQQAKKAARVGLYNDGYMGSDSDLGTYSDRNGETSWLSFAPAYGGEFSGADEWRMKYTTWQPEFAVKEMYRTNLMRINSNIYKGKTASQEFETQTEAQARLNEIKSLYEKAGLGALDYKPSVTVTDEGKYKAQWRWFGYDDFTFDKTLNDKLGVSCDNSAFYGQDVWTFIKAHLGYRYVLRSSEITKSADPGEEITLKLSVENTGFSEAPSDKETEIILSNGKTKYTFNTDINAKEWSSAATANEEIKIKLPKAMEGGSWKVYLRISNINEDSTYDTSFCTKLANKDIDYDTELGANCIGDILVNGESDPEKAVYADTRAAGYYPRSEPIAVDDNTKVDLLDKKYKFTEDGHNGFTFIYKVEGVKSPIQLGNWYTSFTVNGKGYSSSYTTYGLNTMNLNITEDGYYMLHIPFFGAVFNINEATVKENSSLDSFTINDSRNYWSDKTYTQTNGNSVKITPIAFVEGGQNGCDVTVHLDSGDIHITGEYGFDDKVSQTISNIKTQPLLSLIGEGAPEKYADENGTWKLLGYTTKKDDASGLIDENFAAYGNLELYPLYELSLDDTDLNTLKYTLTNGCDDQTVRYVTDTGTMTASVGDGSDWENNSGYSGNGAVVIPSKVVSDGKTYSVSEIGANAFSGANIKSVAVPMSVSRIGENAFPKGTRVIVYEGSRAAAVLKNSGYDIVYLKASEITGDVNGDGAADRADVTTLLNWLVRKNTAAADIINADVNKDGKVNVFDLVTLKRIIK